MKSCGAPESRSSAACAFLRERACVEQNFSCFLALLCRRRIRMCVPSRYFIALPTLLAELCLGRNYSAINVLETLYPQVCVLEGGAGLKPLYSYNGGISIAQPLLLKLIGAKTLPGILRAGFAKLCLHLHIDRAPMSALDIPNYTRTWDSIALKVCTTPARGTVARVRGPDARNSAVLVFSIPARRMS